MIGGPILVSKLSLFIRQPFIRQQLFYIGIFFGPPHFQKIILQFFVKSRSKQPCLKVQNALFYRPNSFIGTEGALRLPRTYDNHPTQPNPTRFHPIHI